MKDTTTRTITSALEAPDLPTGQVLIGDALQQLHQLPSASIDTVVTSPPYFRLRDYGVAGQIGLEASVEDWVDAGPLRDAA